MKNSFEENKLERQFKVIYSENFLKKVSEGNDNGIAGEKIAGSIMEILKGRGKKGLAGMADLSEIDISEIENIKEDDEGILVDIKGFVYKIINTEDEKNLPDGNYYNFFTKKFVVKYNNGDNLLEYSPYRGTKKMIETKTGKVFGKDNLLINGFCGQIGNVLSDEKNIDPKTNIIIDYNSEYKDMVGRYDIGIGYFEGEVKNKYGSDSYVGFEGNGIFRFDNGVILTGTFTIEHYFDTKEIYGSGEIKYPNGKKETGCRGGKAKLYEKLYK